MSSEGGLATQSSTSLPGRSNGPQNSFSIWSRLAGEKTRLRPTTASASARSTAATSLMEMIGFFPT